MDINISDKKIVGLLASMFQEAGIHHIVISPGSRNAPLTVTFAALPQFECYTVVDERSAGFFALGIAQQLREPVAVMCTSGSALLNYAPAVSEAYYQGVPLLVVSADRPQEWIGQADGQTIRQQGVLDNFVKYSCQLPAEIGGKDDEWYANRMVNEALYNLKYRVPGPVHINIPFKEPLYGKKSYVADNQRMIRPVFTMNTISDEDEKMLAFEMGEHPKVMILLGQYADFGNDKLISALVDLVWLPQVVILNESLSNISIKGAVNSIDSVVSTLSDDEIEDFRPTLLVTFDGAVVSKMVKNFLRGCKNLEHWHIGVDDKYVDTYQHLTRVVQSPPHLVLSQICSYIMPMKSSFADIWKERSKRSELKRREYLQGVPWSDMKAFEIIGNHLPDNIILHISNSSPVRYAQLFDQFYGVETYCNRGTSGIDGCTSTAVGAALVTEKPVLLITGDLSFLYDSNGLWNRYLKPSFRVIVINNGGGGIFRFISGEGAANEMDNYFVAKHQNKMYHIAMMYGFNYLEATDVVSLEEHLKNFFNESQHSVLLEVTTSSELSADILKAYFKNLKI